MSSKNHTTNSSKSSKRKENLKELHQQKNETKLMKKLSNNINMGKLHKELQNTNETTVLFSKRVFLSVAKTIVENQIKLKK